MMLIMEKGYTIGLMVIGMKDNIEMINEMGRVFTIGLMVIGKKENTGILNEMYNIMKK